MSKSYTKKPLSVKQAMINTFLENANEILTWNMIVDGVSEQLWKGKGLPGLRRILFGTCKRSISTVRDYLEKNLHGILVGYFADNNSKEIAAKQLVQSGFEDVVREELLCRFKRGRGHRNSYLVGANAAIEKGLIEKEETRKILLNGYEN